MLSDCETIARTEIDMSTGQLYYTVTHRIKDVIFSVGIGLAERMIAIKKIGGFTIIKVNKDTTLNIVEAIPID